MRPVIGSSGDSLMPVIRSQMQQIKAAQGKIQNKIEASQQRGQQAVKAILTSRMNGTGKILDIIA
jgi:hypothetical protein